MNSQTSADPQVVARQASVRLMSASDSGHREEYNRLLTGELAQYGIALAKQPETRAGATFFAMLDDHWPRFVLSALRSTVTPHRTVGLFFNPGRCFQSGKITYPVKRALFSILSRLPRTAVITILPFSVDPRLGQVATDWIHDPQLWDLQVFRAPPEDAFPTLDRRLREAAQGREIVLALGALRRIKGFDYMADLFERAPELRKRFLFVAAGKVHDASRAAADRFTAAGGLLIDRRMEDAEMWHLYRRAALVWSCYAPDYDQASGVLGRAVQFGVPVTVRAGSFLENLADELGHPSLVLPFDDVDAAAKALLDWKGAAVDARNTEAKVKQMHRRTNEVLAKYLAPQLAAKASRSEHVRA